MTNVEIKEMIKSRAGFDLFCNTPKHLLEGKNIQLAYLCVDEDWFDDNENLDNWIGCEEDYDGCQPIEWDASRGVWVHDFSEEVWTKEDFELWKEEARYNAQDFFAVISEEDIDVMDFAVKHEICNMNVAIDCWGIETNEYGLTTDVGSKPAIHSKGRVPAFNTSGEYVCHLVIDPSVKNEAAGGPVVE